MRFADLVATSRAVAETSGRLKKIGHLASLLTRLPPDEIEIAAAFLSGSPRQGAIGIGGAALAPARHAQPSDTATLELRDVDAAFERIRHAAGAGASQARAELLGHLFGRATRNEQDFLVRLIFGDLRQGGARRGPCRGRRTRVRHPGRRRPPRDDARRRPRPGRADGGR